MAELEKRVRWHQTEDSLMKKIPHIKVIYEDDLKNRGKWDRSMEKVFMYLGIPPVHVQSDLLKTDPRPYDEVIDNYRELIEWLKKTSLGYLIQDIENEKK